MQYWLLVTSTAIVKNTANPDRCYVVFNVLLPAAKTPSDVAWALLGNAHNAY